MKSVESSSEASSIWVRDGREDIGVWLRKRETPFSVEAEASVMPAGVACMEAASAWLMCVKDLLDSLLRRLGPATAEMVDMAGGARPARPFWFSKAGSCGVTWPGETSDAFLRSGKDVLVVLTADDNVPSCLRLLGSKCPWSDTFGIWSDHSSSVDVFELFLVSSGDCVVESSHSFSSSSPEDWSPSSKNPVLVSCFGFGAGANPSFLSWLWEALRPRAVAERFFLRLP